VPVEVDEDGIGRFPPDAEAAVYFCTLEALQKESCTGLYGVPSMFIAELHHPRFGALNLFFGGVQAVLRAGGRLSGAGDPRRGGVAVVV